MRAAQRLADRVPVVDEPARMPGYTQRPEIRKLADVIKRLGKPSGGVTVPAAPSREPERGRGLAGDRRSADT